MSTILKLLLFVPLSLYSFTKINVYIEILEGTLPLDSWSFYPKLGVTSRKVSIYKKQFFDDFYNICKINYFLNHT